MLLCCFVVVLRLLNWCAVIRSLVHALSRLRVRRLFPGRLACSSTTFLFALFDSDNVPAAVAISDSTSTLFADRCSCLFVRCQSHELFVCLSTVCLSVCCLPKSVLVRLECACQCCLLLESLFVTRLILVFEVVCLFRTILLCLLAPSFVCEFTLVLTNSAGYFAGCSLV